jgi:hypothetical protein
VPCRCQPDLTAPPSVSHDNISRAHLTAGLLTRLLTTGRAAWVGHT